MKDERDTLPSALPCQVSVSEHVLVQQLGDESVLFNVEDGFYYGLDDVGTRIWEALVASDTVEEARTALLNRFDVPAEQLDRDLGKIIGLLSRYGLLQIQTQEHAA